MLNLITAEKTSFFFSPNKVTYTGSRSLDVDVCSEGHFSASSINIDLSLSSNPQVPFKFVPVIFFTAKDSIRDHILHFSCYNSLAFFRLQNYLIFPWLSWLWHYQSTASHFVPELAYPGWWVLVVQCSWILQVGWSPVDMAIKRLFIPWKCYKSEFWMFPL